jgi:biopolymer transport protein ExbD
MKRTGIIIRLIDVTLIILLGFLMISDFQAKKPINLPEISKEEIIVSDLDDDSPIATVLVSKDKTFRLSVVDGDTINIDSKSDLEYALYQYYINDTSLVVLIIPEDSSDVQSTVNVIDICEKYNLPRNLAF